MTAGVTVTPPILLTVSAPPCAIVASPLTVAPTTVVPVPAELLCNGRAGGARDCA